MHSVSPWTGVNPIHHCTYKLGDKPSWESLEIDGGESTSTPLLDMAYAPLNVRLVFVGRYAVEFDLIFLSTEIILNTLKCVVHKHTLDFEPSQFIRRLDLG